MILLELFTGKTIDDVHENSSFPIDISDNWRYVKEPNNEELHTLRELDRDGIVLT